MNLYRDKNSPVCGRFWFYPNWTGKRKVEGGLRTEGIYKQAGNKENPLVTIITVCLNSSSTITQCMNSVFQQSYRNIEYIVIDGGSTDDTINIIEQYQDFIDYYISEPDSGLYNAMNKGISLASGDYILILNSDDWYVEDCVEALVKAKIYSCADFVSALAQYVDGDGNAVEIMRHMPYDDSLRLRMPLRHETMLLSSHVYNRIGYYNEKYRILSDWDMVIRLFEAGYTLYEIPKPLLFFRNNGISQTGKSLFSERIQLIGKLFPFLTKKELDLFSNLAQLTPSQLKNIIEKHPKQKKFLKSLQLYINERKNNKRQKKTSLQAWQNAKFDDLRIQIQQEYPLISVILPFFNAESTIQECLESVLKQTLKNFEIICINDCSPDKSQNIVDRYSQLDSRVISIKNETNIGLGATRNRGIKLARGSFIFHIDPDDLIPENSLKSLYNSAVKYGSDLVKGSYLQEQFVLNQPLKKPEVKSICRDSNPIVNTCLRDMPELLRNTAGHWSYLYKSDFAKSVSYPSDLKMGQDSIFMVRTLTQAKTITVINDIVYHYRLNQNSAMNTFNFRKYMDSLEWRRRSWHVLNDANLRFIGDHLLQSYWQDTFFKNLILDLNQVQLQEFFEKFRATFREVGISPVGERTSAFLRKLFPLIISGQDDAVRKFIKLNTTTNQSITKNSNDKKLGMKNAQKVNFQSGTTTFNKKSNKKLKVATFTSWDHKGAGNGSQWRVAALRKNGVDAQIFSLMVKSSNNYVERIVPRMCKNFNQNQVWEEVRKRAIFKAKNTSGYCANELFSLHDSVLDFRNLKDIFNRNDIIHLHWVVGMLDYDNIGEILKDKPVVWTLADMNAFTGGCHYSEGCKGYTMAYECKECPLLGGSNLAHETWKYKKKAYEKLNNLHIVCPSSWLAERVKESSLLGDKPVHVIPNAFPIDKFIPVNQTVARIKLGLPLKKYLILFGADSLKNARKGSDLFERIIREYHSKYKTDNVEVVVFGSNNLQQELPLPIHKLGYLSGESQLSLVYSAADVYVLPSREDNAPLTVGESLLCGTPVAAFPVGNVPDLVEHKRTGYIAKYLDCTDMVDGILWTIHGMRQEKPITMTNRCRQSAVNFHHPDFAAKKYIELYYKMLSYGK